MRKLDFLEVLHSGPPLLQDAVNYDQSCFRDVGLAHHVLHDLEQVPDQLLGFLLVLRVEERALGFIVFLKESVNSLSCTLADQLLGLK